MRVFVSLAAAILITVPLAAQAQSAKPEAAIKYRKAVFTVMGAHFSRNAAMVKGERPFNAQEAAANAAVIETLARLPWTAFTPGTDKGETRARPEVWAEPAKFTAAQESLLKAVGEFSTAAKGGNEGAFKTAFGELAKSCKGCHDDFRKE
jgi:cytochrome c556